MKSKYYLYVRTETSEFFLTNNSDHPEWGDISELATTFPMFYPTLTRANEAMRSLIKPFSPIIAEVREWGTEE